MKPGMICKCIFHNDMDLQIHCSICRKSFHLSCFPISNYDSELWSSWFCETCASEFPFNMLDDEQVLSIKNYNTKDEIVNNNTLLLDSSCDTCMMIAVTSQ